VDSNLVLFRSALLLAMLYVTCNPLCAVVACAQLLAEVDSTGTTLVGLIVSVQMLDKYGSAFINRQAAIMRECWCPTPEFAEYNNAIQLWQQLLRIQPHELTLQTALYMLGYDYSIKAESQNERANEVRGFMLGMFGATSTHPCSDATTSIVTRMKHYCTVQGDLAANADDIVQSVNAAAKILLVLLGEVSMVPLVFQWLPTGNVVIEQGEAVVIQAAGPNNNNLFREPLNLEQACWVLGLPSDASKQQVNAVVRKRRFQFHPDKCRLYRYWGHHCFVVVGTAYDMLQKSWGEAMHVPSSDPEASP
jgi:hypothetical protein